MKKQKVKEKTRQSSKTWVSQNVNEVLSANFKFQAKFAVVQEYAFRASDKNTALPPMRSLKTKN